MTDNTQTKQSAIASIIDRLSTSYRKPCSLSFIDSLDAEIIRFADRYGYDRATIKRDFTKAMFLRNRTGERAFKGIAY